jgi:hypothetical protein
MGDMHHGGFASTQESTDVVKQSIVKFGVETGERFVE